MKNNEKITPELLFAYGFIGQGKSASNTPLYRFTPDRSDYPYQIQIELNNFSEGNPNNGVVSIYLPESKDEHCITQQKKEKFAKKPKIDVVIEEDGDYIVGIQYVTFPGINQPIAWGITIFCQLDDIILALTGKHLINRYETEESSEGRAIEEGQRTPSEVK